MFCVPLPIDGNGPVSKLRLALRRAIIEYNQKSDILLLLNASVEYAECLALSDEGLFAWQVTGIPASMQSWHTELVMMAPHKMPAPLHVERVRAMMFVVECALRTPTTGVALAIKWRERATSALVDCAQQPYVSSLPELTRTAHTSLARRVRIQHLMAEIMHLLNSDESADDDDAGCLASAIACYLRAARIELTALLKIHSLWSSSSLSLTKNEQMRYEYNALKLCEMLVAWVANNNNNGLELRGVLVTLTRQRAALANNLSSQLHKEASADHESAARDNQLVYGLQHVPKQVRLVEGINPGNKPMLYDAKSATITLHLKRALTMPEMPHFETAH